MKNLTAPARSSQKKHQGFSLIEALIGIAIIGTVAMLLSQFGLLSRPATNQNLRRSCDSLTKAVIDSIQDRGIYRQIFTFAPLLGLRTGNNTFSLMPDVLDGHTWNAALDPAEFRITQDVLPPGQPEEIRNFTLIDGSIRALTAIYNSNPGNGGFCDTWRPYARFTAANLQLPSDLQGVAITAQIRPYNLLTGAVICPPNLRLRPQGLLNESTYVALPPLPNVVTTPQVDATAYPPVFPATNAGPRGAPAARNAQLNAVAPASFDNVGIAFHVRVAYQTNGQNFSCESSQRFQYHQDTGRPAQPSVARIVVGTNSSYNPAFLCQNNANHTVSLEVGFAGAMEGGSILMCRDRSERLTYAYSAATANQNLGCYQGGQQFNPGGGSIPAQLNFSRVYGMPNTGARAIIGANDWVPCDRVTACNVAATSVTVNGGAGPTVTPTVYRLNYTIPAFPNNTGCDVIVDVVAVDTAGNRSDIVSLVSNPMSYDPGAFPGAIASQSAIKPAHCGVNATIVPPNGINTRFGTWCHWTNTGDPALCAAPTPGCWWGPYSTAPASWDLGLGDGPSDYRAQFPNGYYTCRPTGCCTDPPTGGPGSCVPM